MARKLLTRNQSRAIDFALLAAVAAVPLVDLAMPGWQLSDPLTVIFIIAILGLGLNILTGFTGLLNLGVAAFGALGAYAFSICTCEIYPFQLGFWPALGVTIMVGAIAGFLLGAPTLRVRGDYLAIVTLGFGEIVKDTLINMEPITKGTQGINPVAPPSLFGVELGATGQYYLMLGILVVVVIGARSLEQSRVGRAWFSIREDSLASRAMGIPPDRTKMLAFATCAALAALYGGLIASRRTYSGEPANYGFELSVLALCIVIVGGLGSVRGVLVGALVMEGMNSLVLTKVLGAIGSPTPIPPELLQESTGFTKVYYFLRMWADNVLFQPNNWKFLIFGLALVLMMRYRPEGLLPPRGLHEEEPEPEGKPA